MQIGIFERSESADKPGSVECGHLSTPTVADRLQRYSRLCPGGQPCMDRAQTCIGRGLHGTGRYRPVGELLPRLSTVTYPQNLLKTANKLSISVALSLKLPSPDVIRRPALRCPDFPHRANARRDRIAGSNPYYYSTKFIKRLLFSKEKSKKGIE